MAFDVSFGKPSVCIKRERQMSRQKMESQGSLRNNKFLYPSAKKGHCKAAEQYAIVKPFPIKPQKH
jgi:hypothetical protein